MYFVHSLKVPENEPSQKEIHLPTIDFDGRFVSFR